MSHAALAADEAAAQTAPDTAPARRTPLVAEGEGGFSQTWYPICLSSEVAAGAVAGFDFLDGRVAVYRGASGAAHVMSAYCPHMGADLARGDVIGDELRCAFHHWTFDGQGKCVKTRVGDPAPSAARLFRFPTQEKYGLIWAFNGAEPLFDLPSFELPEADLLIRTSYHSELPHDPAIGVSGAFDMQHFWAVHEFEVELARHFEEMEFHDHHVRQNVNAKVIANGMPIAWQVDVYGPNIIFMEGFNGPAWHGHIAASTQRAPGRSQLYMITAVKREDGEELLAGLAQHHDEEAQKDVDLLVHSRFTWGAYTKTDRAIAAWFAFIRKYPRAHPAAGLLR